MFGASLTATWRPGYVEDEEGALRIHVFMASIPADGEDLKFAQDRAWIRMGHLAENKKPMDFIPLDGRIFVVVFGCFW